MHLRIFTKVLQDAYVDINVDPELALSSQGLAGGMYKSSCPGGWGLVFLHWAERLATAMLPSPLLLDHRTLDDVLLRDLRKYADWSPGQDVRKSVFSRFP